MFQRDVNVSMRPQLTFGCGFLARAALIQNNLAFVKQPRPLNSPDL
jgi:hypothetical protein